MIKREAREQAAPVSPWVKAQAFMLAAVLLLLSVCTVLITGSLRRVDSTLELVQKDLDAIDMEEVNNAVSALQDAAVQLAAVDAAGLNETAKSLKAAADSLAGVDIETLNGAISSLKDAAATLKDLDIGALNGVIQSLNKAVTSLQKVSDTISGIFGKKN